MKRRFFLLLATTMVLAGVWSLQRQRTMIAEARTALGARGAVAATTLDKPQRKGAPQREERPASELLRLRNEVTLLRRDLESPEPRPALQKESAEDWASVHSGPKPSSQPGFGYFTKMTNVGFSTPQTAFQSFNFAMRNQQNEPLNNTRMKELWDVPDDFDDPDARYSIHMGEGMGGEIGYRIVSQDRIAPNQMRLTVDYERPDGSSFRREKVLVENKGRWRMKLVSVTREQPAEGR